MLSAFERRQASEDNPLWRQNVAIIRQLYQDERKTLKEVKAIMENEKGFPVTPLPTWEVKLRELGIQKKLKAKDWSLIYQHVYPRLKHQGKKEFRKPTVVLIHGTKKPWDKCWKEMRRNRALTQRHRQGPLPPLPSFITVRTPSPELLESIVTRQTQKDLHFLVHRLFQTTVLNLKPLFEIGISSLNEQNHSSVYPAPDSVYKLCLQGIPFTVLLEESESMLQSLFLVFIKVADAVVGSGESPLFDNRIIPSSGYTGNLAISGCTNPLESQHSSSVAQLSSEFTSASPAGQQLGLKFDSHHYLSMVIYLLSNNLVSMFSSPHEVTVSDILQMTLRFVSRPLLSSLFQSQLLSIKAGWERLLLDAQELRNKEAFEFFINIGIQNDWLEPHDRGHNYLFSAAQMNCQEIFCALIDKGCQIASCPSWPHSKCSSIIVETINNGNLEFTKLLLQNCDVNGEFRYCRGAYKSTHFAMFITAFDDTRPDHFNCLNLLLERGANVDYEFQPGIPYRKQPGTVTWWKEAQSELEKAWPLSILDYVYYCHRASFPALLKYSKKKAHFNRAMALWNLEQSPEAFRQYFRTANPCGAAAKNSTSDADILERKNHCLEILLAEQFLLSIILTEKTVLWSRMTASSKLETNLMWLPKKKESPIIMLYATACFATSDEGQHKEKGLRIMQWLRDRCIHVTSKALLAAYTHGGATIMQYLASFCNDINIEGGQVLVKAIFNNDLTSAKLLLHTGVDANPNMIVKIAHWEMNAFEAAACGSTLATMKYLVQRGVQARIGICGHRPSLALAYMFLYHPADEIFNKLQYIVDEHMMIYEPLWPSIPLLELCIFLRDQRDLRRRIFTYLLEKGAGLNIGSPLAVWIAQGGGHQLVQHMLCAGADPNAYSFTNSDPDYTPTTNFCESQTPLQAAACRGDYTLVCLLLDHGADVNAPASSKSLDTKTALQGICAWDPVRREERLRKSQIVQLLIDKGADVDAANSSGYTALMEAARSGDISTAFDLLTHGARPNAISKEPFSKKQSTALDIAAEFGRLDMVKFLLNANALSSTSLANGEDYEGAIKMASKRGHLVVSELIKKHSAERHRWNVPSEISVTLDPEHTRQSLSLRAKKATVVRPLSRTHHTATKSPSSTSALDRTDNVSNTREEEESESSPAASKAEEKGTTMTEVTDASSLSGVEDTGDRAPLLEAGCDESRGARTDEVAHQALHTDEAESGNETWLYDPRGQSWVIDDQRSAALLAQSSLSEDVFMGFSGFQSS